MFLYQSIYNLGHNILRIFDVLPIFSFTTSETNRDGIWYIRVASRVAERHFRHGIFADERAFMPTQEKKKT